eukprot:gene27423-30308_t
MNNSHLDIAHRLEQLTELSVALSTSRNIPLLLERILQTARSITHADGGTLYRAVEDGNSLAFDISMNDTLHMHQGGSSANAISIPNIALRNPDGSRNLSAVSVYAANERKSVNIADVYQADGFNFSGMRSFDEKYNYHSQSFLT